MRSGHIKGLIAGIVVILGAFGAYFLFSSKSPRPVQPVESVQKTTNQLKEVKPVSAQKRAETTNAVPEKVQEPGKWHGVEIDHKTVKTNGTMVIERIYTKDGKSHIYYHDDAPPVLEHYADQILSLATSDNPHAPPLPLNAKAFEDSFAKALRSEIVINETDSDTVKALKERVREARKGMAEMMAQGMSVSDILNRNEELRKQNYESRQLAVQGLKEYLEKGDMEGAQEYCNKMNQALDQMGIMRIEIPQHRERKGTQQ